MPLVPSRLREVSKSKNAVGPEGEFACGSCVLAVGHLERAVIVELAGVPDVVGAGVVADDACVVVVDAGVVADDACVVVSACVLVGDSVVVAGACVVVVGACVVVVGVVVVVARPLLS